MELPHLLMIAPMHRDIDAALAGRFKVHHLWEQSDEDAFLAATGSLIRGLVTSGSADAIDACWFDRLPALEIVANFGVGYDHIDVQAATARDIVVTNTPGVLDAEVADLTLGLLLATVRHIPQADRFVRGGSWETGPFPLSPTLQGRRVGVLGLGAIGKAIARRLEGFDVAISYHGRTQQPDVSYDYCATPLELAAACDLLIVVVPGNADTHHLVDTALLTALGPRGILINVSRGSVVDETALIAALQSGTIAGAGLDVFEQEPNVPAELLAMSNIVLLPHIGSASEHTRAAMAELVSDNLFSWFYSEKTLTPVHQRNLK